jgi:hypothetical protein
MNDQESPSIPEESTKRKRKILTDPERIFAKCQVCQEPGNLDNMIRKQIPTKDLKGVELYQAFNYLYFCSGSCQGLFV